MKLILISEKHIQELKKKFLLILLLVVIHAVVQVLKKANGLKNCGACGGSGRTRASQGFFTVERTCSACSGAGQVITDPCSTCNGEGRRRKNRKIEVNIPAGVEDGSRIRLTGEGAVGPQGATPGDLYLFVSNGRSPNIWERWYKHISVMFPFLL